jgi:hypothetical protein
LTTHFEIVTILKWIYGDFCNKINRE